MKSRLFILLYTLILFSGFVTAKAEETGGLSDGVYLIEVGEEPSEANENPQEDDIFVLALETDYVICGEEVKRIWSRPFLYEGDTYVPMEAIASALSVDFVYDPNENVAKAINGWRVHAAYLQSEKVKIYNETLFVPIRPLCDDLGLHVFWNDGLIAISKNPVTLSDETVANYKQLVAYTGFSDKYYYPRKIVNPYVTYTYEQMCKDVDFFAHTYPDLVRKFSIGTSTEGRELVAFEFGKGAKKVVICAAMHAREYITTNFVMNMVDSYALGYVNNEYRDGYSVRSALENVTFVIIPMVNPDGITIAQSGFGASANGAYLSTLAKNAHGYRGWKATANAVDLNNNFDFMWYAKGKPSYSGYAGPYPASEPETIAMQNFIMTNDFEIFASMHTQGQVLYWMDPNCDQSLKKKFSPYIDRICKEIGFQKMPSDGSVGYSGYMTDYIRYYKKKMAMTVELCPYVGDYPYPEKDFDKIAYPVRNFGLILADVCMQMSY